MAGPDPGRRRGAQGSISASGLQTLRSLDLADLSNPDKLNGAVALQAHEIAQDGYAFPFGDPLVLDPNNGFRNTPYVVNQLGSSYIDLPDFLESRHTIATAEDALAFADRVDAYGRNVDGETERLKHDRGIGVVAPDFTLDKTIGIIGGGAAEKPDQSAVVATFAQEADRSRPVGRQAGRPRDASRWRPRSSPRSSARSRS